MSSGNHPVTNKRRHRVFGLVSCCLVAAANSIKKADFCDWPVFDFIRDREEVIAKFLELYGEPLKPEEQTKEIEISKPSEEVDTSDDVTVH